MSKCSDSSLRCFVFPKVSFQHEVPCVEPLRLARGQENVPPEPMMRSVKQGEIFTYVTHMKACARLAFSFIDSLQLLTSVI